MIKNGPSLQQCSFARGFYKLFTIEVVMIDYKGNGARRFRIQDSSSTEYRLSWNRRCFSVSWRDWWNIAETLRPAYVKTKKEDTLVTALLVHIKKKHIKRLVFYTCFSSHPSPQKTAEAVLNLSSSAKVFFGNAFVSAPRSDAALRGASHAQPHPKLVVSSNGGTLKSTVYNGPSHLKLGWELGVALWLRKSPNW